MNAPYSIFESVMQTRPDDLDMNGHVHNSKYLDYVLAARFDQMERCYGMSMKEFLDLGYSWFVKTAFIEHKRPLFLGDWIVVRTQIGDVQRRGVRVNYEILRRTDKKVSAEGYFDYWMVDRESGQPVVIPKEIISKYSI